MDRKSPSEAEKRDFQKVLRGYDPGQVDAYINKITENYNELYRYVAELERRCSQAEERLFSIDEEKEKAKHTVEVSRAAADKIVSDAYERSDAILASIKRSCDKILKSFRDKIAEQKNTLTAMQNGIFEFKNDLYRRYRLHIELIDKLSPPVKLGEEEEELSPEEYVEKVVSTMNQEIFAEYGISLSEFSAKNETEETEEYTKTSEAFAPVREERAEKYVPAQKKPRRRSRKQEIINLIDERGAYFDASPSSESAVQMLFDFDGTPGSLSSEG